MSGRLSGKNAVVTGSSHGIGRAIALGLAAEGVRVVVNGSGTGPKGPATDLKPLHDVVEEIQARGGTAVASCGSVADFTYAERLIETCCEHFGSLDILVNCAGIRETSSILEVAPELWRQVIDVHLNGTFNCCKRASARMVRQRSGRIINVGSHAFLGLFGGAGYPAAKGGIISLTRAMARELGHHGVTCNVLCPGAKTRLSSGDVYEAHIRNLHARGILSEEQRDGALNPPDPALVVPLVLYLVTDAAAPVNGQVFSASGGYVGLFPEPKEVLLLYRDAQTEGPWTLDELVTLLPAKLGLDS